MDQPVDITAPDTIDDIMDAVTRDDIPRVLHREGKTPVVVMSPSAYWRLQPAHPAFEASWAAAEAAGLHTMTMTEIDEEIAAARQERAADASKR